MTTTPTRTAYELEVREDGTILIPSSVRAAMGLQPGDTVTLIQDKDDVWWMPTRLLLPEVAEYISQLLAEKGMTVDDLLAGLDEVGEQLFKERYGDLLDDPNTPR